MNNHTPSVNNWSSWDSNSNGNAFGTSQSQESRDNTSFMTQQSSSTLPLFNQTLTTPSLGLIQLSSRPKSRSEVSSASNGSPTYQSVDEDFLTFDPTTNSNPTRYSTSSPTTTRTSPQSQSETNPSRVKKRTLNTLAARRYRQKRVDQMQGLESALKETETERDDLKLKVARLEAEVDVLRRLVGGKNS